MSLKKNTRGDIVAALDEVCFVLIGELVAYLTFLNQEIQSCYNFFLCYICLYSHIFSLEQLYRFFLKSVFLLIMT